MDAARTFFSKIIIVADDLFRFEELINRGQSNPFFEFDHCDILPFSYKLRRRLIAKWITLGREYTSDESALERDITGSEQTVDTLIGKNVIPAFPVTILVILQTAQAGQNHTLYGGSYGHYYDALITKTITGSGQISDSTMKDTYLSRLAHFMFKNEVDELSDNEINEFTDIHLARLRIDLEVSELLDELINTRVLERREGAVSFKYRYYYYYFVARQFKSDVLVDSEQARVKSTLRELADYIYFEPYANILIFYLYFNLDLDLIEYVLTAAQRIFREHSPCDFESDVAFFNRLNPSKPERTLLEVDPSVNRTRMLDDLDAEASKVEDTKPQKIAYDDHLSPVFKLNIAFKTQQVLGQVLRNFPGSIEGDLKARITSECYLLGLRTLKAILVDTEKAYPDLQDYLEALNGSVARDRVRLDECAGEAPTLPKNADQFILWLAQACALGIIKRTSYAVGHERLGPTYREVLEQAEYKTAFELIDMSVRLDHFGHEVFAVKQVRDLVNKLDTNAFGYKILQDLIYNYLLIYPVKIALKQKLASLVNIRAENPKLLTPQAKLLS